MQLWQVLGSRFKAALTNPTDMLYIFWHPVRSQIWACKVWNFSMLSPTWSFKTISCRWGVLGRYYNCFCAIPAADCWKWRPVGWVFLALRSYTNIHRRTTTTIALEPRHGALKPFSVGLHVARTSFKSRSAKSGLTAAQKIRISTIFGPETAQTSLRNG